MANVTANRLINGTFGTLWIDDDQIAECFGLQAKVELQKEDVRLAGQLATDSKMVAWKGKGSVKLHKVTTRFADKINQILSEGKAARFTIISKLADPDSYGTERVAIGNVSFDDLTLADWECAKVGEISAPFTFTSYNFLDQIEQDV